MSVEGTCDALWVVNHPEQLDVKRLLDSQFIAVLNNVWLAAFSLPSSS